MKKYAKTISRPKAQGPLRSESASQKEAAQEVSIVPVLDDQKISSVVKIFTTSKEFDYASPWSTPSVQAFSGTGFIIDGQKIVTNGHVVANQVFMKVQIAGSSKKYTAELVNHADHCDLAIITVKDPEFWQKAHVCELGDLPTLRTPIQVYGFPVGGSELSITEGIISRIDFDQYAHSEEELLVVQVDAAINPGNSGGPVFSGNKVVGIVHQGIDGGQNLGYFIPITLLKNVLEQIEHFGHYKGLVDFDIKTQELENKYLRKMAGLKDEEEGLLITQVDENNPLAKFLKAQDVLLKINGHSISNDGTVSRYGSNLSYQHIFHEKKPGDLIKIDIKRNQKYLTIHLPLQSVIGEHKVVTPVRYNEKPSYLIYGGMIFTPLTTNYIRDSFGGFFDSTPPHLKSYEKLTVSDELKQVILLSSILNNAEVEGYGHVDDRVVKKIEYKETIDGQTNSTTVDLIDIYHLAKILSNENITSYLFHLDDLRIVAIDKLSKERHLEILSTYDITEDRSSDIKERFPYDFTVDKAQAQQEQMLSGSSQEMDSEGSQCGSDQGLDNSGDEMQLSQIAVPIRRQQAVFYSGPRSSVSAYAAAASSEQSQEHEDETHSKRKRKKRKLTDSEG